MGRYSLVPTGNFAERYGVENLQLALEPRYNIAPTQTTPVITRNSPNRAEEMRWGLVPFWAKDPSIGNKMINARAETLAEEAGLPQGPGRAPLPGARQRFL